MRFIHIATLCEQRSQLPVLFSSVRACIAALTDSGGIAGNPADDIIRKIEDTGSLRRLTGTSGEPFADAFPGTENGLIDRLFFPLCIYTAEST